MSHVNKTLIQSLTQDLKEVKNLCKEINFKYKESNQRSWLHPLKAYEEIESTRPKTPEDAYRVCLELLLDRLYLLLTLINIHLEITIKNFFATSQPEPICKYVSKPNNLTLGITVNKLWKYLSEIEENMVSSRKQYANNPTTLLKCSVTTQTEETAVLACDSCMIFKQCMRNVANNIMESIKYSNVEKAREKIQKDMYDITQFGCMNQLSTSIVADIKKLLDENQYLECSNTNLIKENEKVLEDHEAQTNAIKALEEKLCCCEADYQAEKKKCEVLEEQLLESSEKSEEAYQKFQRKLKELDELNEFLKTELEATKQEKNEYNAMMKEYHRKFVNSEAEREEQALIINELKTKNSNLEEELEHKAQEICTLRNIEEEFRGIQEENEKMKAKLRNYTENISDLTREVDKWKDKYVDLRGVNMSLEEEKTVCNKQMQNLTLKSDRLNSTLDKLEQGLDENDQILEDKLKGFRVLIRNLEEMAKNQLKIQEMKNAQNELLSIKNGGKLVQDIEVKGDPLSDMKNQIDVNNKNIQILEKQNNALSKTIERLEKIQQMI